MIVNISIKYSDVISGNPYPSIFWQHNTKDVEYDERIIKMADDSIMISGARMSDVGSWMVTANNDLGKVVRKQMIQVMDRDDSEKKAIRSKLSIKGKVRLSRFFGTYK